MQEKLETLIVFRFLRSDLRKPEFGSGQVSSIFGFLYTLVSRKDQFERKNGGAFDADEFNEFPERYISNFAHKFAPYSSVIVNSNFF